MEHAASFLGTPRGSAAVTATPYGSPATPPGATNNVAELSASAIAGSYFHPHPVAAPADPTQHRHVVDGELTAESIQRILSMARDAQCRSTWETWAKQLAQEDCVLVNRRAPFTNVFIRNNVTQACVESVLETPCANEDEKRNLLMLLRGSLISGKAAAASATSVVGASSTISAGTISGSAAGSAAVPDHIDVLTVKLNKLADELAKQRASLPTSTVVVASDLESVRRVLRKADEVDEWADECDGTLGGDIPERCDAATAPRATATPSPPPQQPPQTTAVAGGTQEHRRAHSESRPVMPPLKLRILPAADATRGVPARGPGTPTVRDSSWSGEVVPLYSVVANTVAAAVSALRRPPPSSELSSPTLRQHAAADMRGVSGAASSTVDASSNHGRETVHSARGSSAAGPGRISAGYAASENGSHSGANGGHDFATVAAGSLYSRGSVRAPDVPDVLQLRTTVDSPTMHSSSRGPTDGSARNRTSPPQVAPTPPGCGRDSVDPASLESVQKWSEYYGSRTIDHHERVERFLTAYKDKRKFDEEMRGELDRERRCLHRLEGLIEHFAAENVTMIAQAEGELDSFHVRRKETVARLNDEIQADKAAAAALLKEYQELMKKAHDVDKKRKAMLAKVKTSESARDREEKATAPNEILETLTRARAAVERLKRDAKVVHVALLFVKGIEASAGQCCGELLKAQEHTLMKAVETTASTTLAALRHQAAAAEALAAGRRMLANFYAETLDRGATSDGSPPPAPHQQTVAFVVAAAASVREAIATNLSEAEYYLERLEALDETWRQERSPPEAECQEVSALVQKCSDAVQRIATVSLPAPDEPRLPQSVEDSIGPGTPPQSVAADSGTRRGHHRSDSGGSSTATKQPAAALGSSTGRSGAAKRRDGVPAHIKARSQKRMPSAGSASMDYGSERTRPLSRVASEASVDGRQYTPRGADASSMPSKVHRSSSAQLSELAQFVDSDTLPDGVRTFLEAFYANYGHTIYQPTSAAAATGPTDAWGVATAAVAGGGAHADLCPESSPPSGRASSVGI